MLRTIACKVLAASAFLVSFAAPAADPASGAVTDSAQSTTWTGGPYVFPNVTPEAGEPECPEFMVTCDEFSFTVNLSPAAGVDAENDSLTISISWANAEADFDPYLYDAVSGKLLVNGAGSSNPETMFVPVRPDGTFNGSYRVVVVPFLPLAEVYTGTVALQRFDAEEGRRAPLAGKAVTLAEKPLFQIFNPPKPYTSYTADEPTLGINRNDNKVYMIYNSQYLETEFKDDTSPAGSVWNDVTGNGRPLFQGDPFMGDDEHPLADGTFNPRIWGVGFALAASDMLFSDTPGVNPMQWTRGNTAATGLPAGVDNESIASGPYPEGVVELTVARARADLQAKGRAFYYCAHGGVNAFCIRSDDGGLTYGPGVPIFPAASSGLSCSNHGHVKVGSDGTVYIPMNAACTGGQGVSVSINGGLSYSYIRITNPDGSFEETATGEGRWDSSIGIANDGKTVYYGYGQQGTDEPYIVKGTLNKIADPTAIGGFKPEIKWDKPVNVGRAAKLRNMVFATVVAGDPDRAAFAFHGTALKGDSGDALFKGEWHLYVAMTYNGGVDWEIQNVTPGDPTQKGGICDGGTLCSSSPPFRNLLDFMDMVTDREGRVVVGFADGCVRNCVSPAGRPTYSDMGGLARQSGGKSLFAKFDSQFTGETKDGFATLAPIVTARALNNAVHLAWQAPDDRGSPLLGYDVLRNGVVIAQLRNGPKAKFSDRSLAPGLSHAYQVRAVSALGNGRLSAPVSSQIEMASVTTSGAKNQPKAEGEESVCVAPGITVVEDATGDAVAPAPAEAVHPSEDIEFIAVSEPGAMDNQMVFTLKVSALSEPLLPQHRWMVYFTPPDGIERYVAMTTTEAPTPPKFEYGKTKTTDAGGNAVGQQTPEGELAAGSGYLADGHIALVVNKSDVGVMGPGSFVDAIYAKTRNTTPNPGAGNAGVTRDDTGQGLYDVAGNEGCRGKSIPVAAFTASQITGVAPVTVHFDASDTFVDSANGLSVKEYVWDFGDKTSASDNSHLVKTSGPTVSHTYTETKDEAYRVKLYVIDSNGERSNSAKLMVLLGQESGGNGLLNEGSSLFGGALGIPALLMLGLFSLLGLYSRRR